MADSLRNDEPELDQQAAYLVGLGTACVDEALARRMQRQHGLLLGQLHWHEAHVRPGNGLADRLGIERVVLVGLDVGLDELWRHHLHTVPECAELGSSEVRPAAGLDADQAGL